QPLPASDGPGAGERTARRRWTPRPACRLQGPAHDAVLRRRGPPGRQPSRRTLARQPGACVGKTERGCAVIQLKPLPYLLAGIGLLALPVAQAEELPAAIKAVEARGAEVVGRFDAPGGLQGYAARYNGQGMALYLTPDGEHVLVGSLLDAKGEDLTRGHLEKLVYEPLGKE